MATINKIFKPRRGTVTNMTGDYKDIILENGEFFLELPETGAGSGKCKVKIGNGTSAYKDLPYALGDIEKNTIPFTDDTTSDYQTAYAKISTNAFIPNLVAGIKRCIALLKSDVDDINSRIGGQTYAIKKTVPITGEGAGVAVITDTIITDNSLIDIYTDNYEAVPSSITQEGNTITVTFDVSTMTDPINIVLKVANLTFR